MRPGSSRRRALRAAECPAQSVGSRCWTNTESPGRWPACGLPGEVETHAAIGCHSSRYGGRQLQTDCCRSRPAKETRTRQDGGLHGRCRVRTTPGLARYVGVSRRGDALPASLGQPLSSVFDHETAGPVTTPKLPCLPTDVEHPDVPKAQVRVNRYDAREFSNTSAQQIGAGHWPATIQSDRPIRPQASTASPRPRW
jgi:hypothetical protein